METENLNQGTGCKKCKEGKSRGMSKSQKWITVLAIYIISTSIYGSVELIGNIIGLFK
jgi:hypothetical protein